ncbi:Hypothetical protein SRAE_1000212550 [Strongyloides ratti]|uniref:Uncharacterized protein n=1 Tax=Strongyloides ratti TaxID=34506 RepID=A0A090MWL0_STRRB|nr:Hypothetical protein SRAE_1000212550 [Strongyloides ratti]CEF63869.1 Hypothetical protein SRAE_1000212550 [Strongyloides ratti]
MPRKFSYSIIHYDLQSGLINKNESYFNGKIKKNP